MPKWLVRGLCGLAVGGPAALASWAAVAENKPVSAVLVGGVAATVGAFAPAVFEQALLLVRRPDLRAVAIVEPPSVVGLLYPRQQVVPFRGRDAELRQLSAWCADRGGPVVRLVHAPGGFGKTRLALRLREKLTGQGWQCVFVRPSREEQAAKDPTANGAPGRLLLVVDYAESCAPDGLGQLLAAASLRRGDRVRVLLLARTAGPWWTSLSASVHEHAALLDALTRDRRNLFALGARVDSRSPGEVVSCGGGVRPQAQTAGSSRLGGSQVSGERAGAAVARGGLGGGAGRSRRRRRPG